MRRRELLISGCAGLLGLSGRSAVPGPALLSLSDLQNRLGAGGRLGVAAKDLGTGRQLAFNAGERFAYCSTFKLVLAAAILEQVEIGRLRLDERVTFAETDLLDYAPVTRAAVAQGSLSVERLARAIIEVSDNTAGNLLLKRVGGPPGLTAFLRRLGDQTSRLDRWEPELNENLPGDPRDTTTPAAMLASTQRLLGGPPLGPESRDRLIRWLEGASTGLDRLRAGFPPGWRAGDKTGTGANGAHNDIAVAWPPDREPIVIASFISGGPADNRTRAAVHAEVGRRAAAAFA